MSAPSSSPPARFFARVIVEAFRIGLPLLLLIGGGFLAWLLIVSKPEVPRVEREAQATYVEVLDVEAGSEPVSIEAYGTVSAFRQIDVQPQVVGIVVEQHPELVRGGIIEAGATVFRIDPRDYETVVENETAALARARLDLKIEEGRQVVARREWELLGDSMERTALSEELALRRPQLEEKKAALAAAERRLFQAELDLSRTIIEAPFHALVLEESVDLGQFVGLFPVAQTSVVKLVDVDAFHVVLSVPTRRLSWIRVPDGENPGSRVTIRSRTGPPGSTRTGHVVQLLGDVDPTGRMARVLVEVRDPLDLASPPSERSPLLLGEYTSASIDGPELEGVVSLPRSVIREGDLVWVMDADRRLAVREVDVRHGTSDRVYVSDRFEPGDRIVTSALPAAVPGMLLDADETDDTDGSNTPRGEATVFGGETDGTP